MKILMLVESNFPIDIRVRREAFTLTEHGHEVSVIAIKHNDQKFFETVQGVKVYRIPQIELFKYGKQLGTPDHKVPFFGKAFVVLKALIGYGFEYSYFTIACFFMSLFIVMKDNFDVIHTHNPPDTLFLVATFYKIFGKKFIYDHHDLSPDLFLEKYKSGKRAIYQILLLLEKISCQFADVIIATNESYKKIEIERCSAKAEDIFVVRYGPDLNEMKISEPIPSIRAQSKTMLCYLGEINIQDGVDYLLVTLARMIFKHDMKDIRLLVIGDGDYLPKIKELANDLMINENIVFTGFIYDRDLLNRYLSTADIFVDAAPYSFLNDSSTFIKHMEYMIYEKPVFSFALKESMFSLKDAGIFVKPNDTREMARVILEIVKDEKRKRELGIKARKRVKELSWDKVSKPLIKAYESIKE